ncbi:MAG: hypothetical protein ACKOH7_05950, partial [Solirubrobacterales bacterium]
LTRLGMPAEAARISGMIPAGAREEAPDEPETTDEPQAADEPGAPEPVRPEAATPAPEASPQPAINGTNGHRPEEPVPDSSAGEYRFRAR